MIRYLKMDFYRMFCSRKFAGAVGGIFCVFLFLWWQVAAYATDVFQVLYYTKMYSSYMLVFAFAVVAYSNALVEDAQHKNWYLQIQRGGMRGYVWSKVCVTYLSAVASFVLGTALFILAASAKLPLLAEDNSIKEVVAQNEFIGGFLNEKWIACYLLLDAAVSGLLAGVLALFSMWLSLYVRDRMFTITIPIVGYYFWVNYSGRIFGDISLFSLSGIYLSNGNIVENSMVSFLYAVAFAAVMAAVLGGFIASGVRRLIYGREGKK